MGKKLISSVDVDATSFEDFFLVIAKNIESSMSEAGAIAGKDYNHLDLYKMAAPFVLEKFKEGGLHFQIPKAS